MTYQKLIIAQNCTETRISTGLDMINLSHWVNTDPVLWAIAIRSTDGHLLRTSQQIFFNCSSAIGWYASYSSWTTFLPSKLSLVVPTCTQTSKPVFQYHDISKLKNVWYKDDSLSYELSDIFHSIILIEFIRYNQEFYKFYKLLYSRTYTG